MLLQTAADLFAGCGGTTEGAIKAGIKVVVAANHMPAAVKCHADNHPSTQHYTQDLCQANFYAWPNFDLLLASPACQGHSNARGKERPGHDVTRSTAWAVVACVEAKRPKALVVENVADFRKWMLFPQWSSCLEALDYQLTVNTLDAANVGVPQNRVRLFVVGVHKDYGKAVAIPDGVHQHVAVSTILDENATNWSPINKPGRSPATIARIARGRARFGDRFLMPYYGSGSGLTGRSLDRPVGTITTKDRWALVEGDRMRMFTKLENLRGQGFRDNYLLPDDHSISVHMIGNAVPPPLEAHVLSHLQASLN